MSRADLCGSPDWCGSGGRGRQHTQPPDHGSVRHPVLLFKVFFAAGPVPLHYSVPCVTLTALRLQYRNGPGRNSDLKYRVLPTYYIALLLVLYREGRISQWLG